MAVKNNLLKITCFLEVFGGGWRFELLDSIHEKVKLEKIAKSRLCFLSFETGLGLMS